MIGSILSKNVQKFSKMLAFQTTYLEQQDLHNRLRRIASDESIEYVKKHMKNAISFRGTDSLILLNYGIENVTVDGLYLEFGVFKGESTKIIANKISPKKIHGFDSFDGLPDKWSLLTKGSFSLNGKIPKLPENVIIHKGLFQDTLNNFEPDKPIAFVHIDCDLYSSTKTVFDSIGKNIVKGTIIVFDEYFNYPNWQEHEFKAFQEFVKENHIEYEYLAFTGSDKVCIRILENNRGIEN